MTGSVHIGTAVCGDRAMISKPRCQTSIPMAVCSMRTSPAATIVRRLSDGGDSGHGGGLSAREGGANQLSAHSVDNVGKQR